MLDDIAKILFPDERDNKKINSKIKGNKQELKIAKMLTKWTGKEFVRIPMSGGLRWKNAMNICGDLLCTDPNYYFPLNIEVKHYKNFEIKEKLRINSRILRWYKQSLKDAYTSKKYPVLIVTRNYLKYHLFISEAKFDKVKCIINYSNKLYGYKFEDVINEYDAKNFIEEFTKQISNIYGKNF